MTDKDHLQAALKAYETVTNGGSFVEHIEAIPTDPDERDTFMAVLAIATRREVGLLKKGEIASNMRIRVLSTAVGLLVVGTGWLLGQHVNQALLSDGITLTSVIVGIAGALWGFIK